MVPILSNYLYRFISFLLRATKSLNTAIPQNWVQDIPFCLKYNIKMKLNIYSVWYNYFFILYCFYYWLLVSCPIVHQANIYKILKMLVLTWFVWNDFILKWSEVEVKWVTVNFLWIQVLCTLWWPYTEESWLYWESISFGYILYCVCCNLYSDYFKLFCNVWVCVCVCACPDNVYNLNLFGYPDWRLSVLFPQL
jgi:hypothetical protein